jgi:hypothetical protein
MQYGRKCHPRTILMQVTDADAKCCPDRPPGKAH